MRRLVVTQAPVAAVAQKHGSSGGGSRGCTAAAAVAAPGVVADPQAAAYGVNIGRIVGVVGQGCKHVAPPRDQGLVDVVVGS